MEDETARLRQESEGVKRQTEELGHQRGEEERETEEPNPQIEESNRQGHDEGEKRAPFDQPLTFQRYLEACHSIDAEVRRHRPTTDPWYASEDDLSHHRLHPRQIVPSPDFATKQLEIWDLLSESDAFSSEAVYPSFNQLQDVRLAMRPISSDFSLYAYEQEAVFRAMQAILCRVYDDSLLPGRLGLLDATEDPSVPNDTELFWGDYHEGNSCLYKRSNGQLSSVLAVHYKAPRRLCADAIITGLECEIQPDRDVIGRMGRDFTFASQSLVTAAITELFSYMLGNGTQYGYVCTGEAFIFLEILDDPNTVYYSVCFPIEDVKTDDETGLHRTAVAQVCAFILRALRARPPPGTWHEDMAWLGTWAMRYDDILKKIPPVMWKWGPRMPYKPSSWKSLVRRSPIQTRSHCVLPRLRMPSNWARSQSFNLPTLAPRSSNPPTRPPIPHSLSQRLLDRAEQREKGIRSQPFCTQECLLGLVHGGPLDEQCPNVQHHGREHIGRLEFLRLIRIQLAADRGSIDDCMMVGMSSAISTRFKIRLSSHGYTLYAKGVDTSKIDYLRRENELYDRLEAIQGKHVPVCLGIADLDSAFYHHRTRFEHLMFLGMEGRPIHNCIYYDTDQDARTAIVDAFTDAFREIHKLRVLLFNPELWSMRYSAERNRAMVVDFERAIFDEFQGQQVLDLSGTDSRKYQVIEKIGEDSFALELEYVREGVVVVSVGEQYIP